MNLQGPPSPSSTWGKDTASPPALTSLPIPATQCDSQECHAGLMIPGSASKGALSSGCHTRAENGSATLRSMPRLCFPWCVCDIILSACLHVRHTPITHHFAFRPLVLSSECKSFLSQGRGWGGLADGGHRERWHTESIILIKTLIPLSLSDSLPDLARVSNWKPREDGGSLPTDVFGASSEVSSTFNLTAPESICSLMH